LGDVSIRMLNEYGSVTVTSLDGADIVDSGLILIQAMTEDRPYGFRSESGKITNLGSAPFGVREIDASVQLPARARSCEAVVLDENGYDTGTPVELRADANGVFLDLPRDAVHTVVRRVVRR
jgi:hypothetical protein